MGSFFVCFSISRGTLGVMDAYSNVQKWVGTPKVPQEAPPPKPFIFQLTWEPFLGFSFDLLGYVFQHRCLLSPRFDFHLVACSLTIFSPHVLHLPAPQTLVFFVFVIILSESQFPKVSKAQIVTHFFMFFFDLMPTSAFDNMLLDYGCHEASAWHHFSILFFGNGFQERYPPT